VSVRTTLSSLVAPLAFVPLAFAAGLAFVVLALTTGARAHGESLPVAERAVATGGATAATVAAAPTNEGTGAPEGSSAPAPVLSLAAPVAAPPPLVSAPAARPPHVPLARRWWFWAGLGTAAVGVVLAAIFLGPRDPYSGNATPGTVQIF
jgi:hypothetical protein